ncbi:plasmid recombination protein [Flavonifractor plautii]|uniref:plasmid recombination protein n=1 Tax=Flavonifractor plautii TaxID=292800 RepID=UPI001D01C86D|nr:plasmid recombination protein [Flavonifractor plautii]MCB5854752.1 plasmid recombination protein [Flavonifractor plautii]
MKKNRFLTRMTALLLVLVCMLGLLPTAALAADAPSSIKLEDCTHNGVHYESPSLGTCWLHQMTFDYNQKSTIGFCAEHGKGMGWSLEGQTWGNPEPITDPTVQTMMAYYYAHMVSLRGLRKDATLFNEIVIDVNTMYFERNGGYEYAKQFYEEAFHFIEEKFGADNVISAVMHADEINVAATEELGKEVYHYHLHAMVLPVVEKEILWSKRCKDEKLRGTVKEVVHQISHSKKWKSDIPLTDEKGNPLLRKNGKPMFRASYSILQDELFNHMTEQGFKGFQRGEYGSTAEHLTSLQYQIKQDKERLEKLQKRIQREQIKYEPARNVSKTYNEIDRMGQKTITGKMAISKEDYSELTALAKEGITSRAEISELEQSANYYRQKYFDCANALERMKTKYNELKEKCRPFLQALEHFPEVAKLFTEKVKQLFSFKEAQERAEKEAREKERQERIKARRNKRGMER